MSETKAKEQLTAEGALTPQLGTDTTELGKGEFDKLILSKIGELDPIWISYFIQKKDKKGGRFARKFCINYLKLKTSVEGWRINKIIQSLAASKGQPTNIGEFVRKPNIIARHTTQRGWREKAESEGKVIVE